MPLVDIDEFLPKIVPDPHYETWPTWISHWFGYRGDRLWAAHRPAKAWWLIDLWILVASFACIVTISVTFKYGAGLADKGIPTVIPSIGASAILLYNVVDSPLAQPRNVILGTFVSSLIGLCLTKLMLTNEENRDHLWVIGALSVGLASVVMHELKIVHPPAGAAALLPAVDPAITAIGWWYLPAQLIHTLLAVAVAVVFNNIQRRYPVYWFTPVKLSKKKDAEPKDIEQDPLKPIGISVELPPELPVTDAEVQMLQSLQKRLQGLAAE